MLIINRIICTALAAILLLIFPGRENVSAGEQYKYTSKYTWGKLVVGLKTREVDGTMSPTDERRQQYFMTGAIDERTLKRFPLGISPPLLEIAKIRKLQYATLEGIQIINYVTSSLDPCAFDLTLINDIFKAYNLLK